MALCCHPVVEMSEILGFGLHPDESRLGGVPGLLERGVGVFGDVRILSFLQEVRQCLERWAEVIKAAEGKLVLTRRKLRH